MGEKRSATRVLEMRAESLELGNLGVDGRTLLKLMLKEIIC
jgi:hypothetical protein